MKYFGTVESFDETKGLGFIKPETTGARIGFERSGIAWDDKAPPVIGGAEVWMIRDCFRVTCDARC